MTGPEQVLVEDWCQQYPSHSIGTVEFGPDGALYASAGDGASFNFADYGQDGSPLNPCGDPPGGVGATLTPPTAEGGALRSQDLRTSGDPVTLDGSIIRVDPATGAACPTNPLAGKPRCERAADHRPRPAQPVPLHLPPGHERALDRRRGLERLGGDQPHPRTRPTRRSRTSAGPATRATRGSRATTPPNLAICENLYAQPERGHEAVLRLPPREQGRRRGDLPDRQLLDLGPRLRVRPERRAIPAEYQGALFFADYSRDCIWVDEEERQPDSLAREHRDVRRRRREPGQPRVRPGRQPLLRRLRRRHDSADRAGARHRRRRHELPERPHLDVDDERLGPGREGHEQRRAAATATERRSP